MSIASEITNYANGLSDAYDAVNDMQGIIPTDKNMNNLDTAIRTIPQNQGTTYTAGNGINIDANDEISVDTTVIQEKLTAGSNISISGSTISATDTTYSSFTGATSSVAGTAGLVPAPTTSDVDKYLKGDGTWATVAAGPTVVQTVGSSTTDVMSQAATTSMVFGCNGLNNTLDSSICIDPGLYSPSTSDADYKDIIVIGRNATFSSSSEGSISLGAGSSVTNWNSTALGFQAESTNGVALGAFSESVGTLTEDYGVVSVGRSTATSFVDHSGTTIQVPAFNRRITNVANPTGAQDAATKNYVDNAYSAFTGATTQQAGVAGLVPAPTTSDPEKYLKGDGTWDTPTDTTYSAGTNVQISAGNVISATDTTYSDFTGATSGAAGAHGLVPAPAAGDQGKALKGDGTWGDFSEKFVIMKYGESSAWSKFLAAYKSNAVVYCRASSNANPATGSQTRLAFMAYVSNETNPTNVEFQYVRSVGTKTSSQPVDQVFVYKLESTNGGTWSVQTRDMAPKLAAGTNASVSYSSGTYTVSATDTTYSNMTGATSGTAGAAGLVPAPAAGDDTNYLRGDGTWAAVTAGETTTVFYWDGSAMYKDSDYVTAATMSDIETAASAGPVKIYLYSIGRHEYLVAERIVAGDYFSTVWSDGNGNFSYVDYSYISNTWARTAVDVQKRLTASTGISIDSSGNISAQGMTGATSGAAGAAGLVPAPAAGDDTKYLKGDGTWGTVSDVTITMTSTDPGEGASITPNNFIAVYTP